jgi:S1-C subfamily serine protease
VLGAAAGLAIVWVLGAAALLVPGHPGLRRAAQRSEIVSRLNDAVSARTLLSALARIDPFPSIVSAGPVPAAPDPSVRSSPAILEAGRSVVRVTGNACGIGVEGSGWAAARDLVVTAAHVIAGETNTQVQTATGSRVLPAEPVYFDPRDDIAVLRVPALRVATLPTAPARSGTPGALIGYPENGPLTTTPVRLGTTRAALSRDAYGHATVRVQTILSGTVRHGDSGGPVVDRTGAVQAMVFAALKGQSAGLAVPSDKIRDALANIHGRVSTRDCAA